LPARSDDGDVPADATTQLGGSARGFHRVLRVARTIANLAGSNAVEMAHVAEAIPYRRALAAADPADRRPGAVAA